MSTNTAQSAASTSAKLHAAMVPSQTQQNLFKNIKPVLSPHPKESNSNTSSAANINQK